MRIYFIRLLTCRVRKKRWLKNEKMPEMLRYAAGKKWGWSGKYE